MSIAVLLARGINIAFSVYMVILLIRVLSSWVRVNPYSRFFRLIFDLTEPLLSPLRRLLGKLFGGGRGLMLDFSPIALFLLLYLAEELLIRLVFIIF